MAHPYLAAPPPKSLDRLDFDRALREAGAGGLSAADGAATLVGSPRPPGVAAAGAAFPWDRRRNGWSRAAGAGATRRS
jgi:anhydro-N-acetylmuramic acid kinase